MKVLYTIHSLYNPGGMERVLLNKVTYLTEKLHWDVTIVTTDQKERPTFYPFPKEVRMIDLGINYSDDNGQGFFAQFMGYMRRKCKHKRLLTEARRGGLFLSGRVWLRSGIEGWQQKGYGATPEQAVPPPI